MGKREVGVDRGNFPYSTVIVSQHYIHLIQSDIDVRK